MCIHRVYRHNILYWCGVQYGLSCAQDFSLYIIARVACVQENESAVLICLTSLGYGVMSSSLLYTPGGGNRPSNGKLEPVKFNPGKIIYSKELTFKGGSHGSTLSIIPEQKAKEMASKLPVVPASPSNHYANFLKACKGEEKTRSPFSIAGPLSQVFSLGVMAQKLNTTISFDRNSKKITNNKLANQMLVGNEPRKGWEQYYKV